MSEIFLYLVSFGMVLLGLILKSRKEKELFPTIISCLLIELCIGTIAAKAMAIVHIAITLKSMGISYLVLGIAIWVYLLVKRDFQRHRFNWWNIYSIIMILCWFVAIFLKIFTTKILNQYVNSDAANHFSMALTVMDTGNISNMHFGELFNGMILSIASYFINQLSLYKAFIISDALANLINVFMFYVMASKFIRSKVVKVLLPILCFMYFIGWPLFNFVIGGFGYLSWGVTLFTYIIYLLTEFWHSNEIKMQIRLMISIIISCVGLAFAYMYFIPVTGIIAGITILLKIRLSFNKDMFKRYIFVFLIAVVVGIVLFVICFKEYFNGDIQLLLDSLNLGGWNHMDLYRDFVVFIPAILYMGWHYFRERSYQVVYCSMVIVLMFIGCTLVMCWFNLISSYYFYKSYSILWSLSWFIIIDAINYWMNKEKALVAAYGIAFTMPVVMTLTGMDNELENKGIVVNEKHSSMYPSLYPILDGYGYYFGQDNNWVDDKEALRDVSGYVIDYLQNEDVPLISCDGRWGFWYYAFTGQDSIYVSNKQKLLDAVSDYADTGRRYVVIHQNADPYREAKLELEKYSIIYNNGYYGVYELMTENE